VLEFRFYLVKLNEFLFNKKKILTKFVKIFLKRLTIFVEEEN